MRNITLYSVTLKGIVGFENNFNGTTFHHHFCVKTGVNISAEFLCYSMAPETYSGITHHTVILPNWTLDTVGI